MKTIASAWKLALVCGMVCGWLAGTQQAQAVNATGGTITTNGTYRIHTFSIVGATNLMVTSAGNVEVLVVAGGGGGGARFGGGGGAGGLIYTSSFFVAVSSIPVTVGAGGSDNGSDNTPGKAGSNSVFSTLVAYGGGGGGNREAGGNGGSGGGGGGRFGSAGGSATPAGQGYNGGKASSAEGSSYAGGGGGGAGGPGIASTNLIDGANGGPGITNAISGVPATYAAGGGGGSFTRTGGAGGSDGVGCNGSWASPVQAATVGAPGTGSGGGGGGGSLVTGKAGGSGIVIVRYPIPSSGGVEIADICATNLQADSAGLVGNLTSGDGTVTITCYWGTNDGANVAASWMTNNSWTVSALGYVTNSVNNLVAGRSYFFRYYATNSVNGSWAGDTVAFTTPGAPTVDNANGAARATQFGAQLRGTVLGGYPNPQVWIYWGTTNGETDTNAWDKGALLLGTRGQGGFSTNVSTPLVIGAQYWYRCYVTNDHGGAWASASTNFTPVQRLGLTLTNNESANDGILSGTNNLGGVETIKSNVSTPTLFWWADKNGDGTMVEAAAGLNLATFNLTRTDGNALILNLNDGISGGAISGPGVNSGRVDTRRGQDQSTAPIVITGATDIAVYELRTFPYGWASAADITVYQSGSFQATNIDAHAGYSASSAGSVKMIGAGPEAGTFLVSGGVYANYGSPGSATISGYQRVMIGTGGINCGSTVVSMGTPLVIVTNIGLGGITVSGPIDTRNYAATMKTDVKIQTTGPVAVTNIYTVQLGDYGQHASGDISITAGGDVVASGVLDASIVGDTYANNCGDINITSSVGSITVNHLNTVNPTTRTDRRAGNATLTCYSNLTVLGAVNLQYSGRPADTNRYGFLCLTSTGPNGKITINDLDCGLFRTNGWTFNAGGGVSYINGTLSNFDTETCNRIRAPAGQVVYYSTKPAGNAYLGGKKYTLSGGGMLMSSSSFGTVILFQ